MKYLLLAYSVLSFYTLFSQSQVHRVISIPVERNGILLREPWVGGINAAQFSPCDLNQDGIKDLFVFDRDGNKVLTYISNGDGTDSMYQYAPQYEALFPADLNVFALVRDYNKDGIPDIFTFANAQAGTRVFKGTTVNGELHFDLVCPVLKYIDSPYNPIVFANYTDVPVYADVNGDGDIDVLSYDVFGSTIGYYENQTIENSGNPYYDIDSFRYVKVTSCWGNFSQNINNNSITLNVSCKGGPDAGAGGPRHAGNSLYNFRDPVYNTLDLLNGNVGFNNLIFLQNCGDSLSANICVADQVYPACDIPLNMPAYPAAFGIDANDDGFEDLLIAPNQTTGARDVHNVMYYKNTNNPSCPFAYQNDSFLVHNMLDLGTESKALFYDFNGDGLQDIIVGNYGYFIPNAPYKSGLAFYKNTGSAIQPKFTEQTLDYNNFSTYGLQGIDPAFGDLDGDGKPDLLVGEITGYLHFFKNTAIIGSSFPTMTTSQYFNLNPGPYSAPFIYDVNGDSLNDIIVGREDGGLSYYWNFGTKTNPEFDVDSVNAYFGNVSVAVYPDVIGYSQPFIMKDTGSLKLFVGSKLGAVYEYSIDPVKLRSGSFNLITSDFLHQPIGYKSTISIADINNDGQREYVIGNSRGGLLMYSDSVWDPGTSLDIPAFPVNQQLQVFPNPSKDFFVCKLENVSFQNPVVNVFNTLGQVIQVRVTIANDRITIRDSELSNGIYFIKISDSGKDYLGKVLIER